MKNFSIVVLCHNNKLEWVLDAILRQRIDGDEIIVVNDHSDKEYIDKLQPYLRLDDIKLIDSDLVGNRSRNRNIGAKNAKNPLLLFVDGDIVLMDNCMNLIRMTLESGYAGAFGNIIQGGNTPMQMNLLAGFDYLKFLEQNPPIEEFYKKDLAYDKRAGLIQQNILSKSEWQYYYSGYCAAAKTSFFDCGMFNESFVGWGAEDVEFGYRLEKHGDIKFITGAYAYHVSHDRDLYKILQTNKKNIYQFFSQQPCHEMEIFLAFHLNTEILDAVKFIKDKIKERKIIEPEISKGARDIIISVATDADPNGCVTYSDGTGVDRRLSLMGVALPFNNDQFECAHLSENIFCYPEPVAVRIIQECYRTAKNVKIYKVADRAHIHWNGAVVGAVFSVHSGMDRLYYRASLLNDFTFADDGEYYTVTGGIATKMPNVYIDNLPDIYGAIVSSCATPCLLFDFTSGLNTAQLDELTETHNIEIKGVYKCAVPRRHIRLSETLCAGMHAIDMRFVYVVDAQTEIDKNDIWWAYKNRGSDKIVVYQV